MMVKSKSVKEEEVSCRGHIESLIDSLVPGSFKRIIEITPRRVEFEASGLHAYEFNNLAHLGERNFSVEIEPIPSGIKILLYRKV